MPKEADAPNLRSLLYNQVTGRGLGLAVAMSLVRAWGGMIYVNSEVNEGSCFSGISASRHRCVSPTGCPDDKTRDLQGKRDCAVS